MEFNRVIPRDLFNEAKLLKCVGRLILRIHDNDNLPCEMSFEHIGNEFKVKLLQEGSLTITNIIIKVNGKPRLFKTTYNAKRNYPFLLEDMKNGDVEVFDEKGEFTQDFIDYVSK